MKLTGFWTFVFIVISTTFRPICPPAFFRCLSNSGTFTELRNTSFIESIVLIPLAISIKYSCIVTCLQSGLNLQPPRISLTLSRHSSLSFIALGRSSGQHPVSSHSCWMYVRAGRPAFARPCVGVLKSTSLMSSYRLLQQCPACLVRLWRMKKKRQENTIIE